MTITIDVGGVPYTGFDDVSVNRSVETASGGFSFSTSASLTDPFPLKAGQACVVRIKDTPVLTGFIEKLSVSYDSGSHSINISGRDKTCDLIDSSLGVKSEFTGTITLKDLCRSTLDRMGLVGIGVIQNVADIEPFNASDFASGEVDKKGFDFLETYARQRQVYITTDGRGNLVLTRTGSRRAITALQNIVGAEKNNILSASFEEDQTERFNSYRFSAQQSLAGLSQLPQGDQAASTSASIATQEAEAEDKGIRSTRRMLLKLEESGDAEIARQRAVWEANIRRAKSRTLTAVVQGFFQDIGETRLWVPNEIVAVNDDFTRVHSDMLVISVEYSYSVRSGSRTTLKLSPPDALSLVPTIDKKQSQTSDVANERIETPT